MTTRILTCCVLLLFRHIQTRRKFIGPTPTRRMSEQHVGFSFSPQLTFMGVTFGFVSSIMPLSKCKSDLIDLDEFPFPRAAVCIMTKKYKETEEGTTSRTQKEGHQRVGSRISFRRP